jgi:hypothetical protein
MNMIKLQLLQMLMTDDLLFAEYNVLSIQHCDGRSAESSFSRGTKMQASTRFLQPAPRFGCCSCSGYGSILIVLGFEPRRCDQLARSQTRTRHMVNSPVDAGRADEAATDCTVEVAGATVLSIPDIKCTPPHSNY